ncbi:MAG: type I-B CRISPR-associated protein Cas7/Cst2/DevR, partial [Deltaproteobacteria bacterium]
EERWVVKLPNDERIKRIQSLLDALNILWGGGRTARMLSDLSPKFLAYARLKVKHPVFLEALKADFVDGSYRLLLAPLINALARFKNKIETVIFGIDPGFLANEEEVKSELSEHGSVTTVSDAVQIAKRDVEKIWSS